MEPRYSRKIHQNHHIQRTDTCSESFFRWQSLTSKARSPSRQTAHVVQAIPRAFFFKKPYRFDIEIKSKIFPRCVPRNLYIILTVCTSYTGRRGFTRFEWGGAPREKPVGRNDVPPSISPRLLTRPGCTVYVHVRHRVNDTRSRWLGTCPLFPEGVDRGGVGLTPARSRGWMGKTGGWRSRRPVQVGRRRGGEEDACTHNSSARGILYNRYTFVGMRVIHASSHPPTTHPPGRRVCAACARFYSTRDFVVPLYATATKFVAGKNKFWAFLRRLKIYTL